MPKEKNDKMVNQLNFNNDRVKKYEKILNMLFQSPLVFLQKGFYLE